MKKSEVTIEIHGAHLNNKGAFLMLLSTISSISARLEGVRFVVDSSAALPSHSAELGVGWLQGRRGWMGSRRYAGQRYRLGLMLQRGMAAIRDMGVPIRMSDGVCITRVNALVDASGFAFGDYWSHRPVCDFSRLCRYYASRDRPILLLPQSFGPFSGNQSQQCMQSVVHSSDRVYARDTTSLQYLQTLVEDDYQERKKLYQAPDITMFYGNRAVSEPVEPTKRVVIVPNHRVARGKVELGSYLNLLASVADQVAKCGLTPIVLLHDAVDMQMGLGDQIASIAQGKVCVEYFPDPLHAKRYIQQSWAVIGSRYHAILAALSGGVPVTAIGWSHKYQDTLNEFGLGRFSFGWPVRPEFLESVNFMLDATENARLRMGIWDTAIAMRAASEDMWDSVANAIEAKLI